MEEPHRDLDPDLLFKRLTANNWLDRDPALDRFVQLGILGPRPSTNREWAERFLSVELDDGVPLDVLRLFAVARAIFVYGVLFYPFYGLGEERVFVVADAAVGAAYAAAGGARTTSGRLPSYLRRINWLKDEAIISTAEADRWHSLRDLRNIAAHPEQQLIYPPGPALEMLISVARDINALFESVDS